MAQKPEVWHAGPTSPHVAVSIDPGRKVVPGSWSDHLHTWLNPCPGVTQHPKQGHGKGKGTHASM
eukprot:1932835-Prorocentrum_lima.AAC.1